MLTVSPISTLPVQVSVEVAADDSELITDTYYTGCTIKNTGSSEVLSLRDHFCKDS